MVLLLALMARCLGHGGLIGPYTGRSLWALWPYGPCSFSGEEPWTIAAPSDGRDPWTSWYVLLLARSLGLSLRCLMARSLGLLLLGHHGLIGPCTGRAPPYAVASKKFENLNWQVPWAAFQGANSKSRDTGPPPRESSPQMSSLPSPLPSLIQIMFFKNEFRKND